MLRAVVGALLLGNVLFLAWSQGALAPWGLAPQDGSEPQRLAQQIKPQAVAVLPGPELKKAEAQAAADAAPRECLLAGPFEDERAAALRARLESSSIAADAWQLQTVAVPERWVVYIGKFANVQALEKKRAELSALNLKTDPVTAAHLAPGLSLARLESEAAANEELNRLRKQGVRTARVVQERAASQNTYLRLPAATEALKAQVQQWEDSLGGKALRACE
ncbi:MAG: SPOR domain-containing protein [Rhodoferax sp.]